MNKKITFIILLIFLVFSFYFRYTGLKWGLPIKSLCLRTYHPDEPLMLYTMQNFQPSKLNFDPGRLGSGDLFIYITGAVIKIANILKFVYITNDRSYYENNLAELSKLYLIGRLLVILFFLISCIILFFFISKIFNEFTAFLSIFIINILPVFILEGNIYYTHVPLTLPLSINLIIAYKILNKQDIKYYIFSGIITGAAAAIEYDGIIISIFTYTSHFLFMVINKYKIRNWINKKIIIFTLVIILSFFTFAPYTIKYYSEIIFMFKKIFIKTYNFQAIAKPISSKWYYYLYHGPILGMGVFLYFLTIISIIFIGTKLFFKKTLPAEKIKILFLLISSLFVAIFYIVSKTNYFHYFIINYILFAIFISYFFTNIFLYKNFYIKIFFVIFLFISLLFTINYSFNIWKIFNTKDIREEVSDYIENNIPFNSMIGVVHLSFATPPILQAINQTKYKILDLSQIDEKPDFKKIKSSLKELENYMSQTQQQEYLKNKTENKINFFKKNYPDYFIFCNYWIKNSNEVKLFYNYLKNDNSYELIKIFSGKFDIGINSKFVKNWQDELRFAIIIPSYEIYKRIK